MTEAEWLACADIWKLTHFLHGRASNRQWRLFAHACCNRLRHLLTDELLNRALSAVEMYADGLCSDQDLVALHAQVRERVKEIEAPLYDDTGMLCGNDLSCAANAVLMAVNPEFTETTVTAGMTSTIGSLVFYTQSGIATP